MKTPSSQWLFAIVIFLFSTFDNVSRAQENPITQLSSIEDFQHLFFADQRIFDIKSLRPVTQYVPRGYAVQFEEAQVIGINNKTQLFFYNAQGKEIGKVVMGGGIIPSPDYTYVIYPHEGDIWKKDIINFSSLGPAEQLTQLGGLNSLRVINWVGALVYLSVRGQIYALNVNTKELRKFGGTAPKVASGTHLGPVNWSAPKMSPYGKNGIIEFIDYHTTGARSTRLIRFSDQKEFMLDAGFVARGYPLYQTDNAVWLSEDSLFLIKSNPNAGRGIQNHAAVIINPSQRQDELPIVKEFPAFIPNPTFNNSLLEKYQGRSRCVSPDKRHIIFIVYNSISTRYAAFGVMDLQEGTSQIITNYADPQLAFQNSIMNPYAWKTFTWIDKNSFIYSTQGDLMTQGTWIYRVDTQETKKVSSYVGEAFFLYESAGYVVFRANDKIYRIDLDGENMVEFPTKRPVNRYTQIGKLQF
ncbi:MAG: hypothetical protein AAFR61_27925 [Bacteroidota bacterium]